MRRRKFTRRMTVGSLCILAVAVGCAQYQEWGEEPAPRQRAPEVSQTVESIRNTRLELVRAEQQVNEVLTAMDRFGEEPADLQQTYTVFSSEVAETAAQAEDARQLAQQMRERWQQYIANWEQEIDKITTPELRQSMIERRQTVRDKYDQIRDAARAVDTAYDPFIRRLQDLERALSLDLTPVGVEAAQPAFESTREAGAELKQEIKSFIAQLDDVSGGMLPQVQTGGATT